MSTSTNTDQEPLHALPASQPSVALLSDWFIAEVLPLEPALMRLLRRHWRHPEDLPDLRQEIYVRVYESVRQAGFPASTPAFVFVCARNLLIDRARRAQIVSFDVLADLEDLPEQPGTDFTPERLTDARQELQLLEQALNDLSPRCREVVMLCKIDGLTHKQISARLGIAEGTIEKQITVGVRALAERLGAQGVAAAVDWVRRMGRREREQ